MNRRLLVAILMIAAASACGDATGSNTSGEIAAVSEETEEAPAETPGEADEGSTSETPGTDTETQTDSETGTSDMGTQTDEASSPDETDTSNDESEDSADAGMQTDETSDDDDPADETDESTTAEDADNAEDVPVEDDVGYDLNGKWEGSYTCSQGFTRVTLQIIHDASTHQLDTVFAFFADDSNPDVPTGRFTMDGTYDPATHAVVLTEDAWIEQPGGYIMISLSGTLDPEANVISGTVLESGCSTFTVARGG